MKQLVKGILPLVMSGSLLWLIFKKWPLQEVMAVLATTKVEWVALGLLLGFVERFTASQRVRHLLLSLAMPIGRWAIYRIALMMNYTGFLLPGILAGAPVRMALITRHTRDFSHTAAAVLLDRVVDMWMLFLSGSIAALWVAHSVARVPGLLLTGLALTMGMVIWLARKWAQRSQSTTPLSSMSKGWFQSRLTTLMNAFATTGSVKASSYRTLAVWSLAGHCAGVFQYLVYCIALGIAVPFIELAWLRATIMSITLMPISFAGIGVRDLTLLGSLTALGYSESSALGLSWLVLAGLIAQGIAGVICTLTGEPVQISSPKESF